MSTLILDEEAGQVSSELARRGIPARARVRVVVELAEADPLPMAALARAGAAFDFLSDEPDLYSDSDTIERRG